MNVCGNPQRAIGSENFDVVLDLDGSNAVTMRRVFGSGFDDLVAREDASGVVKWYGTDHLGSVRAIFDNSGGVSNAVDYDAFGGILSGVNVDRYSWTGREADSLTGLRHNRAREYDPAIGRWTSEDPIGFAAGDVNLFRYVGNEATGAVDPNGMIWPVGHHWVPNEVISIPDIRSALSEIALDFAAGRISGFTTPAHGGRNNVINGVHHANYSKYVEEEMRIYMKDNNISTSKKMTLEQMVEFSRRIRDGEDLKTKNANEIKKFNDGVKAQQAATGRKPPLDDIATVQKRGRQYRVESGRFLAFAGITTVLAVFSAGTAFAGNLDNISQSPLYRSAVQSAYREDIAAVEKALIGGGDSDALDPSHLFGTIAIEIKKTNPFAEGPLQQTHTYLVHYFSNLAQQRNALACPKKLYNYKLFIL